jgi:hypothetical protein
MKKLFFASIACMGLSLCSCRFEPLPIDKFDRTLTNLDPTFDRIFLEDLVQLSNKDIVGGGRVLLKTGKYDALLVRLNAFGDVKEVAHFDSDSQADDEIASMTMDESENIYLAGRQKAANATFKGLFFKISTKNRFEKKWHKLGENLVSRTNYSKILYNTPNLMVMRSTLIGGDQTNGPAGYFIIDTTATNKTCATNFDYYDVHGLQQIQDKMVFGGVSYLTNPAGPSVVTLFDPATCTKTHRTSFGNITAQSEFNFVGALSAASDGSIYTIIGANTPNKSLYFRPFFFKLKPDATLTVLNAQTANVELPSDTVMQRMSCEAMLATNDNGFVYAVNYFSPNPDTFYTAISKRNSTFTNQLMWQNPVIVHRAHTKKLIPIDNNEFLLLCGRSAEMNRVIKINSKGIVE